MKILVTGAAGFIGAATSAALLERGDEVVGFDNLNAYYSVELKKRRLALLESDDPVVRNNLGEVLIEQGLPQAGLRELLAAEHLSGGEKYIRYNLCVACLLTGRFEAAAEYWRKFLRTKGKRGMPEEAVCSMPLPAGPETEER